MSCHTLEGVKEAILSKGYKWFENGDYNLNLVGIRNSETENLVTNKFDDCVTVSYKVDGEWNFHCFKATTDPGTHWTENLLNKDGVAILVPDQYRGSHTIGLHQGKYKALRQKKPLKVYRDKNKDGVYDLLEENIHEGIYGINIHRATAHGESKQVDKWSAGCQVLAKTADFDKLMELAQKSSDMYGNSFTYTLIESKDI
ncbi:MAG: hypothetical protein CL662_00680 [Bacteroidetes bacterium]|nr:hypothetical protein [Bacteroidota bacterium]